MDGIRNLDGQNLYDEQEDNNSMNIEDLPEVKVQEYGQSDQKRNAGSLKCNSFAFPTD